MKEQVNMIVQISVVLMIDKERWPEDWTLEKEIAHQIIIDDALEWAVDGVRIVGP